MQVPGGVRQQPYHMRFIYLYTFEDIHSLNHNTDYPQYTPISFPKLLVFMSYVLVEMGKMSTENLPGDP